MAQIFFTAAILLIVIYGGGALYYRYRRQTEDARDKTEVFLNSQMRVLRDALQYAHTIDDEEKKKLHLQLARKKLGAIKAQLDQHPRQQIENLDAVESELKKMEQRFL